MIKFFRKIRQRLLTENKFSKYILYAIGEIMLVVIGILIALQVNNKNELGRARAVEVNYLKNLKTNLLDELKNTEAFAEFRFQKAKTCSSLLHTYIPRTIEDVQDYTNKYEQVFFWKVFVPINNTFKELLSSGNLSLIKNGTIKNGLLELEKNYADIYNIEHHMRREYEVFLYDTNIKNIDALPLFDLKTPTYGLLNRLKIDDIPKSKHNKLIEDAQRLYNNQIWNNGIKLAMMNNGVLAGFHQNMTQIINELIALIDEEILL